MITKIVIAGKNTIAVKFAEYLKSNFEYEILSTLNSNETFIDSYEKSFGLWCKRNKIKIITLQEAKKIKNSIFFSVEYDKIINPKEFLNSQLFNIHFSYLPFYRGVYTSFWPIINNETFSGVSLHKIDEGVDSGDIIDQKKIFLTKNITGRELYSLYSKYAFLLLTTNFIRITENNYNYRKQNLDYGSYYDKKSYDFNHIEIDLNENFDNLNRFVRALNFKDFQFATHKGNPISAITILDNNKYKNSLKEYFFKAKCADSEVLLWKEVSREIIMLSKDDNLDAIIDLYTYHPYVDFDIYDDDLNHLTQTLKITKSSKVSNFLKSIS
jgi:methionyl-tRNA formyltransferase